jgi:SSS family solute:Na+ symporter
VGGLAAGCLAFGLFFAARVKTLGDQHGHLTYPDFIESRYDSRTRIVATITTAAAYIAFAAGQLVAGGSIIHVLLGWNLGPSFALASAIVIIYTATGGYFAVTYTDWVQFALLLLGIVFVGVPIAISHAGSLGDLAERLPRTYFHIGAWGWPTILAFAVSSILSFFTGMDSFARSFAARSARVARRGALLAVVGLVLIAVAATWLGLAAAILFPEVENSNDILTTFVVELFPTGLKGLVLVAILAAGMATADISILTASANMTRDVYQRYINPDVGQRRLLRISIVASVVAGLLAAFLAWRMQDILETLLLAFTLNSAALFLPTVAAVYWRRTDSRAAFWSISLSLSVVLVWYLGAALELADVFTIDPLWPGLVVSIVTFVLLNAASRSDRMNSYAR